MTHVTSPRFHCISPHLIWCMRFRVRKFIGNFLTFYLQLSLTKKNPRKNAFRVQNCNYPKDSIYPKLSFKFYFIPISIFLSCIFRIFCNFQSYGWTTSAVEIIGMYDNFRISCKYPEYADKFYATP